MGRATARGGDARMALQAIFFYLFAAIAVGAATMVISARNPVHSVLYLILTFFNAAGLFLLTGAEFLAMILLVVYIGAVAVLFLFVVMMLDVDFAEMRAGALRYAPIGALIGGILLVELILVLGANAFDATATAVPALPTPPPELRTNTQALGDVLYTSYVHFFQIAGLILLVAMVGAITLTLRQKEGVRRQNPEVQNARTPEQAVAVVSVESGKGLG